jgi:hypothetical protein
VHVWPRAAARYPDHLFDRMGFIHAATTITA